MSRASSGISSPPPQAKAGLQRQTAAQKITFRENIRKERSIKGRALSLEADISGIAYDEPDPLNGSFDGARDLLCDICRRRSSPSVGILTLQGVR